MYYYYIYISMIIYLCTYMITLTTNMSCIHVIIVFTVMYKSLRASKSNYVKRLCLVVPLVSRP